MKRDSFVWLKKFNIVVCVLSPLPLLFSAGCVAPKQATPVASTAVEEPVLPPPPSGTEETPSSQLPEPSKKLHFQAVGIAFLESENETPNSAEAFVQAEGVGLPAEGTGGGVQKRITALEAARYRALANLAEKLQGLEVTRDAKVVDLAFAGEEVQVNLRGELKGISEVSRSYDEETGVATVVLGVAQDGSRATPLKPLSLGQRKSRAEAAARIHAAALLREQFGKFFVEQDVCVENLVLKHQEARVYVQGLLKGARYSTPRWPSAEKCEVTASLEVDKAELARLAMEEPVAVSSDASPVEGK